MEEQDERNSRMKKRGIVIEESTSYILCILCIICIGGYTIVSKVAIDKGMSCYVLTVYGFALGTATSALLAFIFERNNKSKMSFKILRNIVILGFIRAIFATTLYYLGLEYSSAVFASALSNTVPSITFISAVLLRMEKFEISKWSTQAKILGTIISFGGATLMTLYKGISVLSIHTITYSNSTSSASVPPSHSKWIKGSLFLIVSNFGFSASYILQTITVEAYQAPITLTSLTCLFGTLFSTIMTAILDHKASSWKLLWNITLLGPLYSGIVVFGVTLYVQTLVLKRKGPVFYSAFTPLSTLFVAIISLLILGEALRLGCILGGVLIIIGLYAILWGKNKENGKITPERETICGVTSNQDIETKLPQT